MGVTMTKGRMLEDHYREAGTVQRVRLTSLPKKYDERRKAVDKRIGRRKTDSWFPYNPLFVTQALAQALIESSSASPKSSLEGNKGGCGCVDGPVGGLFNLDI